MMKMNDDDEEEGSTFLLPRWRSPPSLHNKSPELLDSPIGKSIVRPSFALNVSSATKREVQGCCRYVFPDCKLQR